MPNYNKLTPELISQIKAAVKLNEKDNLRTQLMVMIKDYPYETSDILRLGEHYFKDLNGNSDVIPSAIFRIAGQKESLYGETIDVVSQIDNNKSLHCMNATDDGREVARIRINWRQC